MNQITSPMPTSTTPDARTATLELEFCADNTGRTYVGKQFSQYPFHICRPHYMDNDLPGMATLYTQSCVGGVFQGDELVTDVTVEEGAKVHLTTQASTIIHRTEFGSAMQSIGIDAKQGSLIEYLPDPAILFTEARFRSNVSLTVALGAQAIIADAFLSHKLQEDDDPFGFYGNELKIHDATGKVVALDRFLISGSNFHRQHAGSMANHTAHGTLFLVAEQGVANGWIARLSTALDGIEGAYVGISTLPGDVGGWVRYTAINGVCLNRVMDIAWKTSRQVLTGTTPKTRRK